MLIPSLIWQSATPRSMGIPMNLLNLQVQSLIIAGNCVMEFFCKLAEVHLTISSVASPVQRSFRKLIVPMVRNLVTSSLNLFVASLLPICFCANFIIQFKWHFTFPGVQLSDVFINEQSLSQPSLCQAKQRMLFQSSFVKQALHSSYSRSPLPLPTQPASG